MIEYVVMDYEGEPAIIKDGRAIEPDKPLSVWDDDRDEKCYDKDRMYWNSDACEWALEPYEEPYAPLSKDKYDSWCEYGH